MVAFSKLQAITIKPYPRNLSCLNQWITIKTNQLHQGTHSWKRLFLFWYCYRWAPLLMVVTGSAGKFQSFQRYGARPLKKRIGVIFIMYRNRFALNATQSLFPRQKNLAGALSMAFQNALYATQKPLQSQLKI